MARTKPLWLGVLMWLGACGSSREVAAPTDAGMATPTGEPRCDAASPPRGDAAAPPAFSVNVSASRAELCAGECAELTTSARNAIGSVRYAWSDGLPEGAVQRVCPTTTHTYQVDATASSVSGEFTREQSASDRVTVSVRDCAAPRSDVLCELRHRFAYPTNGDILTATQPWVNLATYAGTGALRTSPGGGAWLVGSFSQELDLGAGRVQASAPMSTFLLELDDDCKPVRTLVLAATTPGDAMLPGALAVDPEGNVYVASIAGPLVEYNLFSTRPIRWTSELLVDKFSPRGEPLYRYRIASGPGGMITAIEVNAAGELFASGLAAETTDLGSGLPLGLSFSTFRTFALKIGAQGRHVAQRLNTGSYQIALAGDSAYHVSAGITSFDVLSALVFGFSASEPQPLGVTATQQADLAQRWTVPFAESGASPSIAVGTARGELALIVDAEVRHDERTVRRVHRLQRYASDGKLSREAAFIDRMIDDVPPGVDAGIEEVLTYVPDSFRLAFMRESESDTLVMAGAFTHGQTLAGTLLTVEAGQSDVGSGLVRLDVPGSVVKLDQADAIRWVRQQRYGAETSLRGLDSRPSGEVWVAGQARVETPGEPTREGAPSETPSVEWDLVVRKLRAD
jgi:hypothetical protein